MNLCQTLSADEVVALPIDELALRVLKDAHETKAWNWHNWMNGARQSQYAGHVATLGALNEAWNWLFSHGLVALDGAQGSDQAILITRRGHRVVIDGLSWLRAVERLDIELTAQLEIKARPQFLRGDFEAAAFMAMKEVEVAVRSTAGLSDSLVGTKLMQEAFRPPKDSNDPTTAGSLWQQGSDPGEAVATMELFKGAIGLFKNPASHRRVDLTDATEAAEIVLLADLLLRILDKIN